MYIFYETASLEKERNLFEVVFGLPVIENEFYPPHEYHGLVKYDAGEVILSLNLTTTRRFERDGSDALVTELMVANLAAVRECLLTQGYEPPAPGQVFTDSYGHHFHFMPASAQHDGSPASVPAIRLLVTDLATSISFYRDKLGLTLVQASTTTATFATGSANLLLEVASCAPDQQPLRHNSYLIVFYTPNIYNQHEALSKSGVSFVTPRIGLSDIGHTIRLIDPSGHVLCLYEPSQESLGWGSGGKVKELMHRTTTHAATVHTG